ncbi:hypothetical protein L3Q82_007915 [Scortum barcoo]|uniref:Uncharacterized protein n=1 Tax=Scortum barcoo TaxID=214431 RepID=A0ACB8WKC7_9TELE|nr:hypothetical protein L3Q82_007915 [Scortum barcoo]
MGKKARKSKSKKLSSSSSSEEDEKESKRQDVTSNYKSAKTKMDVNSQESCAAKHEHFPTVKDDSQSTRQIKKPVYRLAKTQATDLKPVNKEGERTKTKSFSAVYHGGNCSSKAKNYVSGKDVTVSGSKTVDNRTSKPLNSNTAGTVPQRAETSKSSLDKSSHRSTSKLKKQLMSPCLVYGEEKEQVNNVLKRKYRGENLPRTGNDSSTSKTRELSNSSSVSKDYLQQKRKELVKELRRKHEEVKSEAKRSLCTDAKTPSASTAKQSSTSAKHSTSMHVVEELQHARSEKRLEVNVLQSYGELTCMDIDPPEEGTSDTHCKQAHQQDLILVLDTNVLLSHLDYVKKIRSYGLAALGLPVVLIPWVVLQELDYLKRGKGLTGSVAHLATPAISYIYNSLKSREPRLWGQSMQQAAESSNGLNAENNDDRVLQCCLQYQTLYPECALILCTNDKNLCSKALLSGVKALSKNDLEAELGRSRHSFHVPQNTETSVQPPINPQIVYLKPPWTLQDVLQCLKKHWIAVFGQVVPRKKLQTVLNLIDFFDSGKTVDCCDTLAALQKAKELVRAFGRSSSRVPSALSAMDNIDNKLKLQGKPPACDVVMNDDDEDKQATSAQVSHQEVWALFENIWSNVCQISLEVFKALCFDPHTMQSAQPAGSPPPPQDALVCLHRLFSIVSQLLQAFSRRHVALDNNISIPPSHTPNISQSSLKTPHPDDPPPPPPHPYPAHTHRIIETRLRH